MQTFHHFNFKTFFFFWNTTTHLTNKAFPVEYKNLLCSTQGKACYPRHPAFQSLHPQAMAIKLGRSPGSMPSPLCKTLAKYPPLCQYDHGSCNGKTMHAFGNRLEHPHQGWPCILKSDEEKSTYAGLAQENGFSPAYVRSLLRLVKCSAKLCTC